jgi:hypothetical protein
MALDKIGLISAVSDLPNKLETLLDEGGSFSAGQVAFSASCLLPEKIIGAELSL